MVIYGRRSVIYGLGLGYMILKWACMYVLYGNMYVCMYVCLYVCMYVCKYVFMYVCMYVCMYVRMYVCMYRSECMHTYLYILKLSQILIQVYHDPPPYPPPPPLSKHRLRIGRFNILFSSMTAYVSTYGGE